MIAEVIESGISNPHVHLRQIDKSTETEKLVSQVSRFGLLSSQKIGFTVRKNRFYTP